MIEICAVSGYSEFGRNMTAVKTGKDVVLIDMGLHLENYIKITEEEEDLPAGATPAYLIKHKAVPNPELIKDWEDSVIAIVPGHAHLDHLGAVAYIGNNYKNATVYGTPFTIEVLRAILADNKISLKNKARKIEINSKKQIAEGIEVELINITHSTPETAIVALHTKEGVIVYASDFKLDNTPTLGIPPNYKRLRELGKKGILALVIESTNAQVLGKTPSENVAKEMLRDVIFSADTKKNAIIVTTFASHLARLKSIMEFGQQINRKVIFLGRSMGRYLTAGEKAGVAKFTKKAEIVSYSSKIRQRLRQIMREGKQKYLIVATGHQGEPKSTLSKMASGILGFNFTTNDSIIFSCRVIPTPTNKAYRERLEKELRRLGTRIYKDVHQSGHAAREDLREMIEMLKPQHILPMHGDPQMRQAMKELALELGYSNIHVLEDGERLKL